MADSRYFEKALNHRAMVRVVRQIAKKFGYDNAL